MNSDNRPAKPNPENRGNGTNHNRGRKKPYYMKKKNSVGATLYTILVFIFLYAPIAVLILFSFNSGKGTAVFEGFSLYWYKELFNDAATLTAFKNYGAT